MVRAATGSPGGKLYSKRRYDRHLTPDITTLSSSREPIFTLPHLSPLLMPSVLVAEETKMAGISPVTFAPRPYLASQRILRRPADKCSFYTLIPPELNATCSNYG